MRVLVTGSEGLIGSHLVSALNEDGCEVVGFDLRAGQDIRDAAALCDAAIGCGAVFHLAAVVDPGIDEASIMEVNLLSTWNILSAAEKVGVSRVIFYSSVNALGIFLGQRTPDYLPIDDDHPCYPGTLYGLSKLLAEEMCERFTDRSGISTICLRPPAVWNEPLYKQIHRRRMENPAYEWSPFWEYGAFLDVRDAASAGLCALRCCDPGHVRLLLCAADISSSGHTGRALAERLLPGVEWRGGSEYDRDPFRALVRTDRAESVLGWIPKHTWRGWLADHEPAD